MADSTKEHPILTKAKLTQMVRHALKSDEVQGCNSMDIFLSQNMSGVEF